MEVQEDGLFAGGVVFLFVVEAAPEVLVEGLQGEGGFLGFFEGGEGDGELGLQVAELLVLEF